MNNRRFSFFVLILACCVGIVFCVVVLHSRNHQHIQSSSSLEPQCAHWAIFRTAQLLGISTKPGEIQRLLPNQPKGHTLAQVAETLTKIGIQTEGYRDDWNSLSEQNFPCIVHLAKPDHYVVVSGLEPEQGYVHIFDDAGNRTRQKRETFEKRWTGYTLHIEKDKSFFNSKIDDSIPRIVTLVAILCP
jgi:ABC-type bacteriocin/lantibiotic exporter with double-glycine peptidase domain